MTRTVIGIPAYGGGDDTEVALRSLFDQTERDVAFLIVDDNVTDDRSQLERLVASEPRATYMRNKHRLGLTGNWRLAFELARELHPEAEYFAWGSDHDVWLPGWLASLVAVLDAEPDAVLAFPFGARIVDGELKVRDDPRLLDTRHVAAPLRRLHATARTAVPGWMIYGLFRSDALARTGVLRDVIYPDRLTLLELSLLGPFAQVPEVLWQRRHHHGQIVARQRRSLFSGNVPLRARLPAWLVHTGVLAAASPAAGAAYPFFRLQRSIEDTLAHAEVRTRGIRRRAGAVRRLFYR